MAKLFDITVIGGGPAGCVTALLLARQQHSVVLIDKAKPSRFCIGETLPPQASQLLLELGLFDTFNMQDHRVSPGILSAWGTDELQVSDFIFSPHGNGWHIDRRRFNQMLMEAAQNAGATILTDTAVASCRLEEQNWVIGIRNEKGLSTLRSRFTVDAGGRSSYLCTGNSRRIIYDHLVAVAGLSFPSGPTSRSDYTLLEAVDEGWFYSALLPSGQYVVVYMTDADLYAEAKRSPRFLENQLRKSPHTAKRVQSPPQNLEVFSAISCIRDKAVGSNWVAVGDSARSFDPLSGQGLWTAMKSAIDASQVINRFFLGDVDSIPQYEQANRKAFNQYIEARNSFYAVERRWPHSKFWTRRHQADLHGSKSDTQLVGL
jgi:flavin-dependent dehydrogenase